MTKLTFTHEITEKRIIGKVCQVMNISCDYEPTEGAISNVSVCIYQEGKFVGEVSKLLEKAEGNPLLTMIEAIDWSELHSEKKMAAADY